MVLNEEAFGEKKLHNLKTSLWALEKLWSLKVNWVYPGPRPILHSSFVEICSVVCAESCWRTNTQTDMGETITCLAEVKIVSCSLNCRKHTQWHKVTRGQYLPGLVLAERLKCLLGTQDPHLWPPINYTNWLGCLKRYTWPQKSHEVEGDYCLQG